MDDKIDRTVVYLLHHVLPDDEYEDCAKLIGVYSSQEEATSAIKRLDGQPGFRDHPDGFQINEHVLNRDSWTEGFVNVTDDMA